MAARHSAEVQAAGAARGWMGSAAQGEGAGGEGSGEGRREVACSIAAAAAMRRAVREGGGGVVEERAGWAAGDPSGPPRRARAGWEGRGQRPQGEGNSQAGPNKERAGGGQGEAAEWRRCGGEAAGTGGL